MTHFLSRRRCTQLRKVTILRIVFYRGFKIQIVDNHARDHKFEWQLIPLQNGKRLLKRICFKTGRWLRRGGPDQMKIMHDPTSWSSVSAALHYAKLCVDDVNSPFWYKK